MCKLIGLQNLNEVSNKALSFSVSSKQQKKKKEKVLFLFIDLTRVVVSKCIRKYFFFIGKNALYDSQ